MKAKDLRNWCDRMGDDAEVELRLTTYYCTNWSTQFVATNQHKIESIYGSGSKNGHSALAPAIVLTTSHSIQVFERPCPVCKQTPPND